MPIDAPPKTPPAYYADDSVRFMSILDFEALLDDGITKDQLAQFRHTRVSGMEEVPEYVNYLYVLGALRYEAGRFVRA